MLETETILIKEEVEEYALQLTPPPSADQFKCGEIFIIKDKLKYVCHFCDLIEEDPSIFENHIFMEHFVIADINIDNKSQKQENACGEEENDCCEEDNDDNGPTISPESTNLDLIETKENNNKNIDEANNLTEQTICKYCNRDLGSHRQYKNHILYFSNQQRICTTCNKKICGTNNLKFHMKIAHDIILPTIKRFRGKNHTKPLQLLPQHNNQTICNYCDTEFTTKQKCTGHKYRFLNQRNICPFCEKKTCGVQQYTEHMYLIHEMEDIKPPNISCKKKVERQYVCGICKRVCKHYSNFMVHQRLHTNERPFVCKLCNRAFNQKTSLDLHERNHHTDDRPFQCNECGNCYSFLRILNAHIRKVHRKHERVSGTCHICLRVLVSQKSLDRHIIEVHRNDRPFSCDICGKSFKNRKPLTQHMKLHSAKKTYSCPYCSQKFSQVAGRRGHIRRVHEKDIC